VWKQSGSHVGKTIEKTRKTKKNQRGQLRRGQNHRENKKKTKKTKTWDRMAAGQAPVEADLPRIFGFFGFFLFSRWFWASLCRALWFFLVFLVFSMVLTSEALIPAL